MRFIVVIALLLSARVFAQPANQEIQALEATLHKQEAANDRPGQEKTLRKLVAAERSAFGEDSYQVWRREQSLLSVFMQQFEHSEAIALEKSMLAKAERVHGKESREVRDVLGDMVGSLEMARMYGEMDPVFQRLLAVSKKLNGERSSLYAYDLMRYGNSLSSRAEYVAAQRVLEQSLAIMDALKENPASILTTLGLIYMQTDQAKAKAIFDRRLADDAKLPTLQRAQSIWWVASIYRQRDRLDLAQPLEAQAAAILRTEIQRIEKANGKEAPDLGMPLFSLGSMLMEVGDLAAADPLLTRAVALQEKLKAPFIPYAQIATLRRKQGRPKEALALYAKAQATMPGGTGLYSMMGDIERELGNTRHAEELYLAAQKDLDKLFGKHAMLVLRLHLGLHGVYVAAKQLDKAERALNEELDIGEHELAFVLASGTEADHLAYFGRQASVLDTTISFHSLVAPTRASAARLALTTILRRKGRILDAAAASLGTLRTRLSPDDQKLLVELDSARAKLAKVAVGGAQMTPDFAKQVAALSDQIQKLEVTLAKKNADLKVAFQTVTLADVQKKIPKGARLVELVNYQPTDVTAPFSASPKLPPRRYAAYVLADHGDPTLVDLGEAAAIDDATAKLRSALADPDNDRVADVAKTLHDLTFGKLTKALGNAKHVLIAPDGALNVVPFAALNDGKDYLVTKYAFTYLTSGRDLLRFGVKANAKSSGPVIFADPDFDGAKTAQPAPTRRSRAMQGLTWRRLPGTAQEADALAKSLAGATVYREKQATEATLKSLHAPSIVHLATHGFFLSDADASVENPLLRSGLVFAGANARSSGADDGVVTALEAAGLDLRGTRLVVMSACETGVGKITNGDGVYGLRRAFVIAGAESLVMSLWEVDDAATRDLMDGYYKKLKAGLGRSAALQAIQQEMHANAKYAHPYYWASFVAAGDSAPIGK
ncbi:MAG TPA: CHAT domain-containing protein [Kofleriaceae bacterium]|nr:CHAT domain-containing protein [Kofleriaceae bacterium]